MVHFRFCLVWIPHLDYFIQITGIGPDPMRGSGIPYMKDKVAPSFIRYAQPVKQTTWRSNDE